MRVWKRGDVRTERRSCIGETNNRSPQKSKWASTKKSVLRRLPSRKRIVFGDLVYAAIKLCGSIYRFTTSPRKGIFQRVCFLYLDALCFLSPTGLLTVLWINHLDKKTLNSQVDDVYQTFTDSEHFSAHV